MNLHAGPAGAGYTRNAQMKGQQNCKEKCPDDRIHDDIPGAAFSALLLFLRPLGLQRLRQLGILRVPFSINPACAGNAEIDQHKGQIADKRVRQLIRMPGERGILRQNQRRKPGQRAVSKRP